MRNSDKRLLAMLVGFSLGPLFAFWGLWFLFDDYQYTKKAVSCVGIIESANYIHSTKAGHWELQTKFVTINNREIVANVSSKFGSKFEKGQPLKLIYDPYNPQDVRLNSFWEVWGTALFLFGIGSAWILGGILSIKKVIKNEKNKS